MVYEEQQQQIQQAQQQLEAQRANLSKQQALLQNPNLLRKQGYGYLLSPAGKPQRFAAMQQVQAGFSQLSQYEQTELIPAQQRLSEAINKYNLAQQEYEKAIEAQKSEGRAISSYVKAGGKSPRGEYIGQLRKMAEEMGIRISSGEYPASIRQKIIEKIGKEQGFIYYPTDKKGEPILSRPYLSVEDLKKGEPTIPSTQIQRYAGASIGKAPMFPAPPPIPTRGASRITGLTTQMAEPEMTAVLKEYTPQYLQGVYVVDIATTPEQALVQPKVPTAPTSQEFVRPNFEDLILGLSGPPTIGGVSLQSNVLADYIASLTKPVPVGKPAEPSLPALSFQTGLQRGTELALNLPTVQFAQFATPYIESGIGIVSPYIEKYIQQNPFVQAVTLTPPIRTAREQIQSFALKYPEEITQVAGTIPFFRYSGLAGELPTFIGGAAELIPTTPLGVIGTVGGIKAVSAIPQAARLPIAAYYGITGVIGSQDISLTKQERTAEAIIGVGGLAGTAFELTPYGRGLYARISGEYAPVKIQPKGFKAVELPQDVIGLVLEKAPLKKGITTEIELPSISPLKRGGFSVKSYQKELFLGEQTVATSQQSFFQAGKDILLEREFFVTPEEPFINVAETRLSRLGLTDPLKFDVEAKLGFGVPKQPQIGIERKAVVTRTGKGGTFKIGTGTELEAIKDAGTIITDVDRIARTSIRGQGVDIYEFKTTPSPITKLGNIRKLSSEITRRTSAESILSSTLGLTKQTTSINKTISNAISKSEPSYILPSYTVPTITRPVSSITPPSKPITPPPSPPPPTPSYPPISPPVIPFSVSPPTTTYPKLPPTSLGPISKRKVGKKEKRRRLRRPAYSVLLRRRGEFIPVARGLPRGRALKTGTQAVQNELSRQFKLVKAGSTELEDIAFKPREAQFRGYRVRKGKRVITPDQYIQRISNALSSRAEKLAIARARRGK